MEKSAVEYWNSWARSSDRDTRDAVLKGFKGEKEFDKAGKVDAEHLVLPFISHKDSVLDFGCGVGRILKWVAPYCREAWGLDISSGMLERAKQRLSHLTNVKLHKLPLSLKFPFPNQIFDFAYFYHVSEHLEREDTLKILKEIRRCIKTKGLALVQFSLLEHADNQREFRFWVYEEDPEGVRSRFYTEEEVAILLKIAKLHPQIRLFIPGELVLVVTRRPNLVRGSMPFVQLYRENKNQFSL